MQDFERDLFQFQRNSAFENFIKEDVDTDNFELRNTVRLKLRLKHLSPIRTVLTKKPENIKPFMIQSSSSTLFKSANNKSFEINLNISSILKPYIFETASEIKEKSFIEKHNYWRNKTLDHYRSSDRYLKKHCKNYKSRPRSPKTHQNPQKLKKSLIFNSKTSNPPTPSTQSTKSSKFNFIPTASYSDLHRRKTSSTPIKKSLLFSSSPEKSSKSFIKF